MEGLDRTVALLGALIAFPTVSRDSNLDMIAALADRLEDCGARVLLDIDPTGSKANLFASLGPDAPGGVLVSGHSDVVPVEGQVWSADPFAMVERDGRLYGRGACDMKGFIAAAVAMAPAFAARPLVRPLHFAFTYDEEVGCVGAQALARFLDGKGIRPDVAIIGEPTSMRIIEGHKGCCEYTTRFEGLAGHGSTPDNGVNAVEFAVRYVGRLLDLREALKARAPDGSRFVPPWTTINPGALTGGITHNVIPETAEVQWEMRPVQWADAEFVKREMSAYVEDILLPAMRAVHSGASIRTEVMGEVAGLAPATVNEARDILMELTGANGCDVVSFGTEAGIFQAMGMSVVVCGPGSIAQAHKPDEYVELDQLRQCLGMFERLGARLSGGR